jgi:hypothetical protein
MLGSIAKGPSPKAWKPKINLEKFGSEQKGRKFIKEQIPKKNTGFDLIG